MSAVTHGFYVRRCFPRISLAVSVTILLKVLVSKFTSVSSSSMIRGANFPPIIALNASATSGSLSFSMSNLILVGFGLLILFMRMWKVVISKS